MKRNLKKRLFSIEKILIIISVICFSCSIYLKNQAKKKFTYLNEKLNFIQTASLTNFSLEYRKNLAKKLEEDFLSLTTFDDNLKTEIYDISFYLSEQEIKEKHLNNMTQNLINAHTILNESQQSISFGYDTMLYSSIFILAIAFILISKKNQSKQKELDLLSTRNETQLEISRDLHDGVAQDLAALKVYLQNGELEKSEYYANKALQEIRYLIGAMHLDLSKGFEEILKQTLLVFETNYGIKTLFYNGSSHLEKFESNSQIELLRILQEALSNTAKHAKASEVTLKITDSRNDFRFIISDNGIGFSESDVAKNNCNNIETHYGLKNIKERVKILNGTVDFINNGGTTIAVCIKDIIH